MPVVLEYHRCVETLRLCWDSRDSKAICPCWVWLCLLHSCALLIRENLLFYLLDVLQPVETCFWESVHKTWLLLLLVSDVEHLAPSKSCSHSGVVACAWVTLVIGIGVVRNRIEGYSCCVQVLLVNSLSNRFWTVALGSPRDWQAHTFCNCFLSLTVRTTLIAQRIWFCSSGEAARSRLSLAFGYVIYNSSRVDHGPTPVLVVAHWIFSSSFWLAVQCIWRHLLKRVRFLLLRVKYVACAV